MKTTIALVISLAVSTSKANAQTIPVTDTLAYLQTIVNNKAQYIGQPFSVLQNSLQIGIKYFFPYAHLHFNRTKETATDFSFYLPASVDEYYLTYPTLFIKWQPYLNKTQSNIIQQTNNNKGRWNSAAAAFYSTGIIADIKIRN